MELQEAKELLDDCTRSEMQDHAFGDAEVFWFRDLTEVASGYFAGSVNEVYFVQHGVSFKGDDAKSLRNCGKEGAIQRNDQTGPEKYSEGEILPGLTKEAVRQELEN